MTDLTAREMIDTILKSLAETRATFRKAVPPSSGKDAPSVTREQQGFSEEETPDLHPRS